MFQNLPLEITLNITRHLEFKDKLNLKRTCRKLNDQIAKAVLYEELDLLGPKSFKKSLEEIVKDNDKAIQKLIEDGFESSLVKMLCLDMGYVSGPTLSQLSNFFPNVNRVITSKEKIQHSFSSDYQEPQQFEKESENPLIKWRYNIVKIDTRYDWSKLKSDIMIWKYPRLTELDLGSLHDTLNFCIRNPKVSFFQNAPLLTTLTLRNAEISVKTLEALHTGFPLIQSFRLFYPKVTREKDVTLTASITPASTVLFLGVYNPRGFYSNGAIFDYISKKYAKLQRLVYSVDPEYDYSIKTQDDFKREHKGSRNEKEHVLEFEKKVSRSIAVFPIYSATESKFFSNLPKSITSLTLQMNNIENALAAVAESNMKFTMLELSTNNCRRENIRLWKSQNTFPHFKKLSALRTLKVMFYSVLQTFTPEIISPSVTRLYIDVYEGPFYIDWVLSKFPSLEELSIDSPEYGTDHLLQFKTPEQHGSSSAERTHLKREYKRLRVLTIARLRIESRLFDFLKALVPHLSELNLTIPLLPYSSFNDATEKINLSNWSLNKLNLSFERNYSLHRNYCIITIQNTSKYVFINPSSRTIRPASYNWWNQDWDKQGQWTEIISDPIKHLKIFDFHIVKIGNNILIDI